MPRSSRRTLLGTGAAMLLLAPFAAGSGKAEELDGELIQLCAEYMEAEAESRRLGLLADVSPNETDSAKLLTSAEAQAELDELDRCGLLDQIAKLSARTPEGLRAKAEAVRAFYDPDPPDDNYAIGRATWSLIRDVAGRAA